MLLLLLLNSQKKLAWLRALLVAYYATFESTIYQSLVIIMIILFWVSKTFWRNGMTLRQRRKLKKKQRRKVAPVCDFKKVSYLAGTILGQSSGYGCHCFLLCSWIKRRDSMLPCFCSEIDYRRHQNMENITDKLACNSCATFFVCFSVLFCFVFFQLVFTPFWRQLWSTTEQMHGNMKSIC